MDKDELERRFAKLPVVDWAWLQRVPDLHTWRHEVLCTAVREGCSAWWIGEKFGSQLVEWYDEGLPAILVVYKLLKEWQHEREAWIQRSERVGVIDLDAERATRAAKKR